MGKPCNLSKQTISSGNDQNTLVCLSGGEGMPSPIPVTPSLLINYEHSNIHEKITQF